MSGDHTGPSELFLIGQQVDLFTEFIHQKCQLCNSIRIQILCPLVTGNLPYIGINHVETGVQAVLFSLVIPMYR